MKTIVIKSNAAAPDQYAKMIEILFLVGNDLQDVEEAHNEGFLVCQERIKVGRAFGNGRPFVIAPDTCCLLWAVEDEVYDDLEDTLHLFCDGVPEREEALANCSMGVLSDEQEEDIYYIFEPISLVAAQDDAIEQNPDLSIEEKAMSWFESLDLTAMFAIAWRSYQEDCTEFISEMILRTANAGSIRAQNFIRNILINKNV